MSIETLLLPAGSIAAVAAVVGVVAYKLVFSRSIAPTPSTSVETSVPTVSESSILESAKEIQPVHVEEAEPVQEPAQVSPVVLSVPIVEAPEPFPEESRAPIATLVPQMSTSIPTDVTAVTNIASPVENATPALVIPTPKRRARAPRRLPTSGGTKRKRIARPKEIMTPSSVTIADPVGIAGQQPQAEQ
ncbi:MAG: hypothetical protein ACREBS_06035 [Nitrososphaerales archaeon]